MSYTKHKDSRVYRVVLQVLLPNGRKDKVTTRDVGSMGEAKRLASLLMAGGSLS